MVATSNYMVVFRIVHIVAGVIWVGSVFLFVVYLQPSAAAIAPAGAPLMSELLGKRRLVDGILTAAGITVLGGLFIYWRDWHTYPSFGDWIGSAFGATLSFGALCAIVAMGLGASITRPNVRRMLALGRQVAESGGPPAPEVAAEIGAIQHRLKVAARVSLALLIVAVMAMASARYA
ncbi:MAG: hypothetical protein ABI572_02255 [Actinomycetota bacterium]